MDLDNSSWPDIGLGYGRGGRFQCGTASRGLDGAPASGCDLFRDPDSGFHRSGAYLGMDAVRAFIPAVDDRGGGFPPPDHGQ